MNPASWRTRAPKPQTIRQDLTRPKRHLQVCRTPDAIRCHLQVKPFWSGDPGYQCFNAGTRFLDGKVYCSRHHPIRKAEYAAHKIAKHIAELEREGFVVTVRRKA